MAEACPAARKPPDQGTCPMYPFSPSTGQTDGQPSGRSTVLTHRAALRPHLRHHPLVPSTIIIIPSPIVPGGAQAQGGRSRDACQVNCRPVADMSTNEGQTKSLSHSHRIISRLILIRPLTRCAARPDYEARLARCLNGEKGKKPQLSLFRTASGGEDGACPSVRP